jgi:lipopolysaccharide/colanic/teichoic acid biosynthesis glycosyltransferase
MTGYTFTKKQRAYLKLKRWFDLLLAAVLLLATGPVILLACLWIKLESKGPVLFRQKRPGYHKEIFTIYKLRSMRIETMKDGRALSDRERLTRSGRFLRMTSIDELPQLFNVIRGEMSFIGPRPFLINDLDTYNEEQLIRFEVLPGITSWAAIHGRNTISIQDKYNYDVYYVRNIGFKIDALIFLKTIALVLSFKHIEDSEGVNAPRIAAEIKEDLHDR